MSAKKIKNAFSLIELSIVILIIGIIIAGVTQGSRLVEHMRLSSARTQTKSSPVHSVKNLVSWYESTLEESFDPALDADDSAANKVTLWYDIVSTSNNKNNASQNTADNQPTYVKNSINGLPTVRFDSASVQFLNLPDGTVPYNNSPYTIFFVARPTGVIDRNGLLGSGSYTHNNTNAFRYNAGGRLINYWWDIDIVSEEDAVVADKAHIATFYYNLSERRIYANGSLITTLASTANEATKVDNTIGKTLDDAESMNGDIAEIIIFDRALKDEERQSIEAYLSKKWGIKI